MLNNKNNTIDPVFCCSFDLFIQLEVLATKQHRALFLTGFIKISGFGPIIAYIVGAQYPFNQVIHSQYVTSKNEPLMD